MGSQFNSLSLNLLISLVDYTTTLLLLKLFVWRCHNLGRGASPRNPVFGATLGGVVPKLRYRGTHDRGKATTGWMPLHCLLTHHYEAVRRCGEMLIKLIVHQAKQLVQYIGRSHTDQGLDNSIYKGG